MVIAEAGKQFLLGVEQFLAGPVVGKAETDEAVVQQAIPVRLEGVENLADRQVGGVMHGRWRDLLVVAARFAGVEFEDEERLAGERPGEGGKDPADALPPGQHRKVIGVGGVLEEREGVALAQHARAAPGLGPELHADRKIRKQLGQDEASMTGPGAGRIGWFHPGTPDES